MQFLKKPIRPAFRRAVLETSCLLLALSGCGGGSGSVDTGSKTIQAVAKATASAASDISAGAPGKGATPFISWLPLQGSSLAQASSIGYTVQPKPGTVSQPVTVTYSSAALLSRGFLQASNARLPVFGLYAGYQNQVAVQINFADGSTQNLHTSIQTAPYDDPAGVFNEPQILKARPAGSTLGFNFFAMKTFAGPTIVVDTDGAIRWVGTGPGSSAVAYQDGGFTMGGGGAQVQRVEFDGTASASKISDPWVTNFTHNFDIGKTGLFAEVDTTINLESTVEEISAKGQVTRIWDLSNLIANYMRSQGDDPANFVRPGVDWFHVNSTAYDPRDDSIIVSSRENFVIKLDYNTGEPIWILGDPTKYWYTFPSLRAKALQLQAGGLVPIGQHAVSITSDGLLMLFNDGAPSLNMPVGAPAGASRSYSTVSAYSIDTKAMTATEVWDFDYGQSIASPYCSSAYDAGDGSLLVDYALAAGGTTARLVGLDPKHQVVFDFAYPAHSGGCATSWNAVPVPLDHLQILQ
jgi:hypothetical protein